MLKSTIFNFCSMKETKILQLGLTQALQNQKTDLTYTQQKFKNILGEYKQQHLNNFYPDLKENNLKTDNIYIEKVIQYVFQKPGKLIRPLSNVIIFEILKKICKNQISKDEYQSQLVWAQAVETLHISSLIHDDIIDNSPYRRGMPSVYKEFGSEKALFTANFLVGRTSRKLVQLNSTPIYQTFSHIIDNISSGEHIQAKKNKDLSDLNNLMRDYLIKTYYKTASLIAHSAKGVGLLISEHEKIQKNNKDLQIDTNQILFNIGLHLGMCFQLQDDILDYTGDQVVLGKEKYQDLREGHLTGPILFILYQLQEKDTQAFNQVKGLLQGQIDESSVQKIVEFVEKYEGIERCESLAKTHVNEAVRLAKLLGDETGIAALGQYFLQRQF